MPNRTKLLSLTSVHPMGGCWHWVGYLRRDGYGMLRLDGAMKYAHRAMYEEFIEVVPSGLELDHLCRVRNCVNPHHLEAVTHAENLRRGRGGQNNARKTHCPQGHPYDRKNTYVTAQGWRRCATRKADEQRRRRNRQQEDQG